MAASQEASRQRVEVGGAWASGKSGSARRWSLSGSRRASAHSADGRPCAGACVVVARGEPGSLRMHRARWVGGGPCLPRCPQPRNRTRRAAGGQVPGARGTPRRADARLRGHRTHGPPTRQQPRAQPRRGRGAAARALVTGECARRPGRRVAKGTPAWRTERGGTGGDRKALLRDDEQRTRRPRRRRAVATAAPAVMGPGTAGGGGARGLKCLLCHKKRRWPSRVRSPHPEDMGGTVSTEAPAGVRGPRGDSQPPRSVRGGRSWSGRRGPDLILAERAGGPRG